MKGQSQIAAQAGRFDPPATPSESARVTQPLSYEDALVPRIELEPVGWVSPASFGERLAAVLVDYLVGMGLVLIYQGVLLLASYRQHFSDLIVQSSLIFIAVWIFNLLGLGGAAGVTIGKRVTGLRVVDEDGAPVTRGKSLLRGTLGYAISGLALGLGFFAILWNADRKGWHDEILGTLVVKSHRS